MLRKTNQCHRAIGSKHRHRIWEAGVLSGLISMGPITNGCVKLRAGAARQMRAVAHNPHHKCDNQEMLHACEVVSVVSVLLSSAQAKWN